MIERSRRVVLLIDYDNLQICASRDTPGRDLQLAPVVQLAQHYGTVILARAYAEWNLSTERLAVYKAGIEPAFAPVLRTESDRSGKSLADTVMVAEGMDMLWTLSPDVVVLATSDKDLIPLVRVAKQRGAFVVVLGSDFTAIPLREMADEHVTYKQLITDSQGRYVTEAGPARPTAALPEPARRRPTRERNGRERTAITPPPPVAPAAAAAPPARVEREQPQAAQPAATAAPGQAPSTAAVEPVAPLTGGIAGDGDAQGLGRRRRRRGSRRRSERIGGPGEGLPGAEGAPDPDELYAEDLAAEQAEGAVGPSDADARGVQLADALGVPLEALPNEPAPAEAEAPPAAVALAPAAPRNRRRSARRPIAAEATPATAETGPAPAETAPLPLEGEATRIGDEAGPSAPAQGADILWATEPIPANGQPTAADAEPRPAEGESDAPPATNGDTETEPAAAPSRPRPRRVASAARGRTRPPR